MNKIDLGRLSFTYSTMSETFADKNETIDVYTDVEVLSGTFGKITVGMKMSQMSIVYKSYVDEDHQHGNIEIYFEDDDGGQISCDA
jgi:hypothetical protein